MKHRLGLVFGMSCCLTVADFGQEVCYPKLEARIEFARSRAVQEIGNTTAAVQAFLSAVIRDPDWVEACLELASAARNVQQGPAPELRAGFIPLPTFRSLYQSRAASSPDNAMYQWALGLAGETKM